MWLIWTVIIALTAFVVWEAVLVWNAFDEVYRVLLHMRDELRPSQVPPMPLVPPIRPDLPIEYSIGASFWRRSGVDAGHPWATRPVADTEMPSEQWASGLASWLHDERTRGG